METYTEKNIDQLAREEYLSNMGIDCTCELCDQYGYGFPVRCEDCDTEVHGTREDIDIRVWVDPDHEEVRCLECE